MSGKTVSTSSPRIAQLPVQTSAQGLPIALGWGRARVKPNLVWYNDLKAIPSATKSGGKGGGAAKSTTYTYTVSIMMALCAGPILGVPKVYQNKSVFTDGATTALAKVGLSLATGALGQSVWGFLTTSHPTQAIGYSGLAHVRAANYPLDSSASLPNHSYEVSFAIHVAGLPDADPASILADFLTNAAYGVPGWAAGLLGDLSDYSDYCLAANLLLSPLIDRQRTGAEFVKEIMLASNAECFWSEGMLKVVPRGDTALTGNGVTWTPNLTPIYDLDDDSFIPTADGDDPITVDIQDQSDAYNIVQVEFLNRANQYNTAIATAQDMANIAQFGRRKQNPTSIHAICEPSIAQAVAQIVLQRTLYVRGQYKFVLPWSYALLEPMDLVTITDAGLGLDRYLVRIVQIDDDEDVCRTIVAEDALVGAAHAPVYAHQDGAVALLNRNIDPGGVEANLLLWSEDLTKPAWSKINATITADGATDQFGSATADALIPANGVSGEHTAIQAVTVFPGLTYTYSVCLQKNAHDLACVRAAAPGFVDGVYLIVDLNAGTLVGSHPIGTGVLIASALNPTLVAGVWQAVITLQVPGATTLEVGISAVDGSGNIGWTGDGSSAVYISQQALRQGLAPGVYAATTSAIAGPYLFNPPAPLINSQNGEVWAAVAGGPNWGGANVWTSVDGTNYQQIGVIEAPCRYGVSTASFAAGSDPDTSHTLSVDLGVSAGALLGGGMADADNSATLCLIDGELIAYETATLTNPSRYDLATYIRRGLLGTAVAGHAAGAPIVRLDSAIFDFPYLANQAGTPVYVKFQSFNTWGEALQDLSVCNAYPATPNPYGAVAALGVNRVGLSLFEKGANDGWTTYSSGVTGVSTSVSTVAGLIYRTVSGAATGGGGGQYINSQSAPFPVTAGERLAVSAVIGVSSNCTAHIDIPFYDAGGAFLSQTSNVTGTFGASGAPTLTTGFVTVPPGAFGAQIQFAGFSSAAGPIAIQLARPMVSGASFSQTTVPAFTAGPNAEPGADVTLHWTAAAILGQGPPATDGRSLNQLYQPGMNLQPNASFRLRLNDWTLDGGGWSFNQDQNGNYAFCNDIGVDRVLRGSLGWIAPPGQLMTLSGEVIGNFAGGDFAFIDVEWRNYNNNAVISYSSAIANMIWNASDPVQWVRKHLNVSAPASTDGSTVVVGRIRLVAEIAHAGSYAGFRMPKIELGANVSPFSDDATFGALYDDGTHIQTLKPAQAGADVTASNTAAAIAGQGALALRNSVVAGTSDVSGLGALGLRNTVNGGYIDALSITTAHVIDNSIQKVTYAQAGASSQSLAAGPAHVTIISLSVTKDVAGSDMKIEGVLTTSDASSFTPSTGWLDVYDGGTLLGSSLVIMFTGVQGSAYFTTIEPGLAVGSYTYDLNLRSNFAGPATYQVINAQIVVTEMKK